MRYYDKIKTCLLVRFSMTLTAFIISLSINAQTTKALWVGETFQCDATSATMGSPYNISWSQSGGYISLSGSGLYRNVTATQYWSGTASVTCSWKYTLYYGGTVYTGSRTWYFTCQENPVSISPTSMTLTVGETGHVSYSHKYSNSYTSYANAYFSCTSSCVSVSSNGTVTAKSPGTAYINVYSKLSDASNAPYCKVTVKEGEVINPTSISISPSSLSMTVGDTQSLSATVSPSNATYSLSWSSSNSNVASVSSSGVVTAKGAGTATVTATTSNGKSATSTITVKEQDFSIGATFKAKTKEGVEMEFMIISSKDKTCQVGNDEGGEFSRYAAIDKSYSGALTIPETVNGFTVTTIASGALSECNIKSVTMPNSITHICDYAFYQSRSLSTINFSNNLVYVGGFSEDYQYGTFSRSEAFSGTAWENSQPDGLIYAGPVAYFYKGEMPENAHITIKEGTKGISEGCFQRQGARNLTTLTVPESVEHVGMGAFSNTVYLNSQPQGILYIGKVAYAYIGKEEMPEHTVLSLKDGTTEITGLAFSDCPNLEKVIIPKSTKRVEKYAFAKCPNLYSITVEEGNPYLDSRNTCNAVLNTSTDALLFGCKNTIIPNDCKSVEEGAFYGCTGLENIAFGDQVEFVGNSAFQGCTALTSIHFGEAVKTLGRRGKTVFGGCKNVESIHIGKSMSELTGYMFSDFVNLNYITVSQDNEMYDSRNNCNAIINKETKQLIKGCGNTVIPNGVVEVARESFYKNQKIEEITIPNSVEKIDYNAFTSCPNLKSVFIGTGLKELSGINPFDPTLAAISIDAGNKTYDSRSNCNAIIEKSTSILTFAFTNTVIPNSVLGIGSYAYYQMKIKSITIPDRVKSIGFYAFVGCSELESIVIGSSVDSINYTAFTGCSSIKHVYARMDKPCVIDENVFLLNGSDKYAVYDNAILHVPQGTKSTYFATSSWNRFENIEEYDPTAIHSVTIDGAYRNHTIYSLSGQRLQNPQKGINIINGKKILVR